MKISEIVEHETKNDGILLHREGIFWRAYEVSAYRFVNHIKSYQIKSKYYKNIRKDIVYLGFPSSYMDTIAEICSPKGYEVDIQLDSMVKIGCKTDVTGYEVWKQELIDNAMKIAKESCNVDTKEEILAEISAYPLATKTPMEAQQYLYDLQLRINGNL